MAEGSLETSQEQETSFTEYFRVLRAEVADYLSARKPRDSGHVRILSEPHNTLQTKVAELEAENERLREHIISLELQNTQLKSELREEYILQYSERLSRSLSRFNKSTPSVRICEVIEEMHQEESWPEDMSTVQGTFHSDEGSICSAVKSLNALETQKMSLHQFSEQCFEQCKEELRGEGRDTIPQRVTSPTERMYRQIISLQSIVRKHKDFIRNLRAELEKISEERSREKAENRRLKALLERLQCSDAD